MLPIMIDDQHGNEAVADRETRFRPFRATAKVNGYGLQSIIESLSAIKSDSAKRLVRFHKSAWED